MMSERKSELEKRLHTLQCDRDSISVALEEASERIMMLEKQTREQEIQVTIFLFVFIINRCSKN